MTAAISESVKSRARRVDTTLTAEELAGLSDEYLAQIVTAAETAYIAGKGYPYQALANRAGITLRNRPSYVEESEWEQIRADIRSGVAPSRFYEGSRS